MDSKRILELLPDYVGGHLDPALRDEVGRAVSADPRLQRECDALKAYHDALGTIADVPVPGDFVAKVNERIDRPQGLRGLARALFLPLFPKVPIELLGLGVTIALVVMVFNPFTMRTLPSEVSGTAPSANQPPLSPPTAPAAVAAERRVPAGAGHESRHAARSLAAGSPAKKADAVRPARDKEKDAFAPEPSEAAGGAAARAPSRDEQASVATAYAESKSAPAAPPMPAPAAAAPQSEPAQAAAEGDVALQRRKVRETAEAFSVMTLAVEHRSIDKSDIVDSRRARSKGREADDAAAQGSGVTYASVPDKAFALAEGMITRNGGSFTVRSTTLTPTPQRIYVVVIPPANFAKLRTDLLTMGKLRDIDLNLDAGSAAQVSFRLAVRVE